MVKALPKRKRNIIHFKRRLYERYGIDLSVLEIEELAKVIQIQGRQFFLKKMSQTRSLYNIYVEGREIPVIYDKKQHCLLTALPERIDNND